MNSASLIKSLAPVYMIALLALLIANGIWAFLDARKRGKSGLLVALMVLLMPFPFGPLAWLVFRPTLQPTRVKRTAMLRGRKNRIDHSLPATLAPSDQPTPRQR